MEENNEVMQTDIPHTDITLKLKMNIEMNMIHKQFLIHR